MKRSTPILSIALAIALAGSVAWAAGTAAKPEKSAKATAGAAPGVAFAGTLSQITGVAISPMLGVSAVGAYTYFRTPAEKRVSLPWYARPSFWIPALLLVAACACKDSLGAVLPPGWKKPLDVAETLENKVSGAVAVGAFVPFSLDALVKLLGHGSGLAHAAPDLAPGLAMIPFGAIDFSWVLAILMLPLAAAIFAVVWVTSHAINVLILLSPWGAVDAALKGVRLALLSLLTLTATINPVAGAVLSLVIILVAACCAGWAFRLTVYGSVFCWDFFTLRWTRFRPAANDNRMFAARKLGGAPARTYGRLHRNDDGSMAFAFRPWLVRPVRSVPVPGDLAVGHGVFYSTMLTRTAGEEVTRFLLPPRYQGHESELARACGGCAIVDVGLRRAWKWLKETLGFGPAPEEPAAALAAADR